ncbi:MULTISPECIES: LacI family DNA-binding transcriptional regulator [Kordiimonas]|jgi:DNA-binding LacI/PurR family transcriptional regulator|uniref:LacI family DNA-binding transcriptional regulator n=1 Tax=Kordiimonas TaxID=288021 RepID=UPI00257ED09B|nr:LacI family DNA-binding transcriptional regulator [Kordiimonas sp. UBA4487]
MEKSKNLTMADIAKLAGVSEATVSRALKDSPLINKETRARVQRIARENNYEINAAARNFRTKKTHTLAVVLLVDRRWGHEVSDAFLMVLLGSIADEAGRQGYDLLLSTNQSDVADLNAYFLESKRADGLIIIGQGRNDPRLDRLAEAKAPFIVWGAEMADHNYYTVGSDNRRGGYDATSLLARNGRRRIAFMGDVRHPEMEHRWEGYQKALDDAGLTSNDDLVIPTDFSQSDGYKKADLLAQGGKPTCDAVFCVSDNIALGLLKRFAELGIRVPDDVAVVGFDDNPPALFSTPGLTSIKQDVQEGGRLLVQNLIKVLNGQTIDHVAMPTELVIRDSCGQG